jgi:hypothetical protein
MFDLQTGTITEQRFAGVAPVVSITDVGGGWYRVAMVVPAFGGTNTTTILTSTSPTTTDLYGYTSYTGDGTSGIYIFGAQLSDSASVDPYVYQPVAAPTSTAYYGPRFDYDPVTLAPKGLLIEEQRTNLFLYSQNFTVANWVKSSATNTANTTTAPDGTSTASSVTEDTATAFHALTQQITLSGQLTISCVLKANTRSWAAVRTYDGTNGDRYALFDLSTGTTGVTSSGTTSAITSLGNGWYRCAMTYTYTASFGSAGITIQTGNSYSAYAGNGTGSLYFWSAQAENGAFATSYIPTVASQVTRAADSASMIGNNFARWYTQGVGTLYADWGPCRGVGSASVGSAIAALTGVAGVNDIEIDAFLGATRSFIVTNSASQGILSNTSVSGFNGGKAAVAYKTDDYAFSVNGQTPLTDTSVIVPIVTQLLIGAYGSNPGTLNGTVKRITYYPRRLANTELISITS